MSQRIYLIVLLIVPLTCAQCQQKSQETEAVKTTKPENVVLSPSEFENLMKNKQTVLLDVRTDREVARGYIKGSKQIDYQSADFKSTLAALDKDKIYLVYCASGGRSSTTQKLMSGMGFTSVYDLKGGIIAWQKEGKEIVK